MEKIASLNHHQQSIQFCPYCGNKTIQKQITNESHAACPNCGWVHYEDPKVAAAVVIIEDERILLTRRIFNPHRGDWTLPAGFVNAYEDPQAAARRECLEETGLEVDIIKLMEIISGREHPRGADMVIVYEASIIGGELKAGDDAAEAAFFAFDDLPELAFQATRQVINKLLDSRHLKSK